VNFLRSISGDDGYFIYSTSFDSKMFGSDLYLTKAMAAAPAPTALVTTTNGALFGLRSSDDFTTDSKYVLWIENLDTTAGVGDFFSMQLPSGTPKMIATGQWQNISGAGSKVVWEDNCPACSATANKGTAYADLKVLDVSTSNTPTTLQKGVDVPLVAGQNGFYANAAKDHVIYTFSTNPTSTGTVPPGGNGLYSIALP
jgi:hypothetical protein